MNSASAGPASGGALTKLAALADCKAGEGAAQQRQYRREAIAGQRAGPAIADRPERSVVDEQQAAAAQQPLDPWRRRTIGYLAGLGDQQHEQAEAVLAGQLAAGARAAESDLAQINLGAVGLFGAAIAFASDSLGATAQTRPRARGCEAAGRACG